MSGRKKRDRQTERERERERNPGLDASALPCWGRGERTVGGHFVKCVPNSTLPGYPDHHPHPHSHSINFPEYTD